MGDADLHFPVLMKKGISYQPPWVYNTWEPFFQD